MSPDTALPPGRRSRVLRTGQVEADDLRILLAPVAVAPTFTEADVASAYERGVADGVARAQAEREHAVVALEASWHEMVRQAGDDARAGLAAYTSRAVADAFVIAEWLLRRELTLDPGALRARLDDALADVDIAGAAVRVAPSAAADVQSWLPEARVVADPSCGPGDLVVDTALTTVDGRIADALARLRDLLGLGETPAAEVAS